MPEAQTTMIKNLSAAFTAAGVDVKGLLAKIGDLGTLTTTQRASLVGALNELKTGIDAAVKIDDAKTQVGTTWSSTKINSAINAAISALVSGAPEALDTIKEVADAINTNKDAITALQKIAAGHVKFDAAQTLNDTQKQRARENIGAVSAAQLAAKLNGTVAKVGEVSGDGTDPAAVSLDTLTDEGEFFVAKAVGRPAGVGGDYQNLMVSVRKSGNTLEQTVRGIDGGRGRVFVRHGTVAAGGEPAGKVAWEAFAEVGAAVDLSGYATNAALAATATKAQKGVDDAAAAKAQADKGVQDAATAKTAAEKANGDLTAFKTNIGDTTVDFAAVYTAARDAK